MVSESLCILCRELALLATIAAVGMVLNFPAFCRENPPLLICGIYPYSSEVNAAYLPSRHSYQCFQCTAVADLGGVRGVQMHPPLAASSVFLRT